ncbi:Uncharacterised protein [Rothia dentocariosa]|uniref:Uncharacterized protein n=2 Tax=Rothia dentocariosa TaxID=2047 RepID=A0A3S5BUB9_9MICC|nr:Uncharacterised protein [Rothia dentocariosa]
MLHAVMISLHFIAVHLAVVAIHLVPDMADWLGIAEGDIIASELIMAEEEGVDDAEELDDALGDEF